MARKKIVRVVFWFLLGYTALSTTVVWAIQFQLIPISAISPTNADEQKEDQQQPLPLSEVTFAEQFTREYFLWSVGKEKVRNQRIQDFLHEKVDPQAGLDLSDVNYNSIPQNVRVWNIEPVADQKEVKKVTVYAETVLVHNEKEQDQKRVNRYLVLTIKKAGSSYRIIDQPYLIAPPTPASVQVEEKEKKKGEAVPETIKADVNSFLHSFWKVYTTGQPKEIAYYYKNKQSDRGLTGIMSFQSLDQIQVVKVGDQYLVDSKVELQDLISGAKIKGHYQLTLIKEGNRFYVLTMKEGEV